MRVLTWDTKQGVAIDGDKRSVLIQKPGLSFKFETLYYEPNLGNAFRHSGGIKYLLTEDQKKECDRVAIAAVKARPTVLGADSAGVYLGEVSLDKAAFVVTSPPPKNYFRWDDKKKAWYDARPIEEVRAEARDRIAAAAHTIITAGKWSKALPPVHFYGTNNTSQKPDQQNLQARYTDAQAATDPKWSCKFWCMDEPGVWSRRIHNKAQILQIGQEVLNFIAAVQDQVEIAYQKIDTAKREAIDAVVLAPIADPADPTKKPK